MELTYNQIIKTLNDFATSHYQINEFGNGDLWEVIQHDQQKDFNYPLLWVQDQPNTTTQGEIEMVFRCFFINLVQKDESNENEVKSDMHQCCLDLLAFWKKQTDYRLVSIDVNTSLTSFTERFNDELTGWWIDIKLNQQFNYDKCSIPMDGITPIPTNCSPATITINGQSFTTADSGTLKDIIVKDTGGTSVGSKIGTEWIVPASAVCGDADNQVNGVAKTAIPSGGSKNFVIQDSIGNPVTVTDVSDSASAYVGEVVAAGAFYYAIPQPTYNTSYNTYDEGWHNINGTYSNTIPVGGRVQALANGNFYKVQFDAETRGHLYRFLGLNGGYYNSDDGLYYDSSHVATTRALVFDTDRYAFDRLTGLALRTFRGGSKNLTAGIIDAEGASWNTFTDWHLPFTAQYFSIIDYTLTVPLGSAGSPIFSLSLTLKSCTPTAATPTVNGNQIKADGEIELTRGYASADSVVYIRDARGQF